MNSPDDTAIFLRDVSKTFHTKSGSFLAVDAVDLKIRRESFVTIVGPSGCGKTTLLKMMVGLEEPTSGRVEINGKTVKLGSSPIGMVFQDATLLPWLTVIENVLLPVRLISRNIAQAKTRAHELLELVNLTEFAGSFPRELSGGMQQRVGIARALINDPDVLLMDEPFGALDAMTREHMNVELEHIWLRSRKTVVFITHSIPEAIMLGDRILVMSPHPGRVEDDLEVNLPRPRIAGALASTIGAKLDLKVRAHFALPVAKEA